jgi:dipeptidyl aminopeptidase/acylaminoacyl peptidase
MRAIGSLMVLAWTLGTSAAAQVPGPERALTDPAGVVSPANPAAHAVAIPDLFQTRSGAGAVLSPDGATLVFSANYSGRFNLWKVATGGGEPVQLTMSDNRQYQPTFTPDGRFVAYISDLGGNEKFDIYLVPLAGGAPVNLTGTPDVSETGPVFSPDGALVAVARKPESEPQTNIWVIDTHTKAARALTREADPTQQWRPVAFTADGRYLIANRGDVNQTGASGWKIDVASGAAERITPGDGAHHLTTIGALSPDGRFAAISSNSDSAQVQAGLLDLRSGAITWLARSPWEQSGEAFSPDGRSLLFSVNEDGRTTLHLYDLASGRQQPLPFPPGIDSPQGQQPFTRDGSGVVVAHEAANMPLDYWIAPTGAGRARQLTHFAAANLDPRALPGSSVVHYASADGTVISAILVMPFNVRRDGTNPAIVLPHGGPTGQTLDGFSRQIAALASRGYIVIAPNVRGSTGYGKAFQDANIKDLGGGDLTDELAAVTWLLRTGYVDARKIGITGGSYGGFMTLMAIGKAPKVWAAAVEEYGIINWFAMLEHEDPLLQQYERGLLGDPVKDKAVYDATSPMTYIHQARAPLLVLQGDNDIRVPKGQAEEVVATLKAMGNVVDAHYYAQEGHGFAKRENQIDALQRTVDWFDRYLKPAR